MKFIKTGSALLLAAALSFNASAQTTTTAMNSTLVPQSWSTLPIVRQADVKGGLHDMGTIAGLGGVTATNLPDARRTDGMIIGFFDSSDGNTYKQFILMSGAGDSNVSNDDWQQILITKEWVASTAYVAGDAVSYQGATYFKISDGNSDATFTPANWYGVGADGSASLSSLTVENSITLGTETVDGIDTDLSNGTGADSLVTAEAVVAYVAAQLGGSVEAGSADNQILVWNNTNTRWEVALGTTINQTTGDIITSGDLDADSIMGNTLTTTGNAIIGGDVTATGNVSGADVTASGALSGETLNVGAGNFTVDADGNVDGAGILNAGGLVTAEAGLTISDTQSLTLGGNAVSGISTVITSAATDDSLATAKAVYDAISDLDAQVGDGTAADQTLRWDGTSWVADGALTNDGTDVTATGAVNANSLSTTEFTVDATGNVSTTGTLNADGQIDLAASGVATTIHGNLTVSEETTLSSTLTMNNAALTTVTVDGIATDVASAVANDSLVTAFAVKEYVDDQLGSGGALYYGSDGTFSNISSLGSNTAIETFAGGGSITKATVVGTPVNIATGEYFFIAVPTNWGALNMFIEGSPMFDGFVKQVVDDYYVYVFQFAVPSGAAELTFAIK